MFKWIKNWFIERYYMFTYMVVQNSGLLPDEFDFDNEIEKQIADELRRLEQEGEELDAELDPYDGEDMFGIAHFEDYPDEVSMEFEYPNYTYRAKVVKIVDGDTIDVMLDLGLYTSVRKRLRFLDMDAWEVRGEEREMGLKATERVTELLDSAEEVMVQTKMDTTGKYGRLLAIVWTRAPEEDEFVNVNQTLVLEGHATVYES